jgi:hypothetical protein
MARKAKKKTVHWTKLPRPKLVSMVKRLELQVAKLKTQLAEARETALLNKLETKLLNNAAADNGYGGLVVSEAELAEAFGVVHVKQEDLCVDEGCSQHGMPRVCVQPSKMPWE